MWMAASASSIAPWCGATGGADRPGFVARMIDHGFTFNGPHWDFPDSPLQGLYARRLVYEGVRSLDDFQPWLDQAIHFPEEVIDQAWKRIPPAWIEGEEDALQDLLERLFERRKRLPELIAACRQGAYESVSGLGVGAVRSYLPNTPVSGLLAVA